MVGEYARQLIMPGSAKVLYRADAMKADADAVNAFDGDDRKEIRFPSTKGGRPLM